MIRIIGSVENKFTIKRLLTLQFLTKKRIRLALHEAGSENLENIRNLMSEKKTGRIYSIGGLEHQASAPGEAPAIRSGLLKRSLFYTVTSDQFLYIGADTRYAGYLEDGTILMQARPYLRRSAEDKERDTYNTLVKWIIDKDKRVQIL